MTTTNGAAPDDMNELYDAKINRVDLVGAAANGHKFLLAKNAQGLIAPETVRDLIKADSVDLTEPLAVEGNPSQPGDRDWEATDAATARKWISVLTRAKHAVELLQTREEIEAVSGDDDDFWSAWDLESAAGAIDCAIGTLAVYAASEDGEVMAQDDAAIVKAAEQINPDTLATIEGLAPLAKAGRVLSASNEASLRAAAEAIQKVLAGLPQAEDTTVEKELAPVADNTPIEPAAGAVEPVAKADSMLAVFDRKGNLIGVVAPDALTPVDGGNVDGDTDTDDTADGLEDVDESAVSQTEGDGANAIDGQDADGGSDDDSRQIPGTDTVQSPVEKETAAPEEGPADAADVTKTADIAAMLKEALNPLAEKVSTVADLAKEFEVLKGRLDAMGREPDDRNSPRLNGATGEAGIAKRAADDAEAALEPLEKAVRDAETAGNPAAVLVAKQQLQFAKIKALYPNN